MYREDKATQMAARFINLTGRDSINYLHLMKMMYEADKRAALQYGLPITLDRWVAMRQGPVLSDTLDVLKADSVRDGYWQTYIQKRGFNVALLSSPGNDDLSEAEEEIIDAVFRHYGHMDRFAVVNAMHEMPEWKEEWNSPDYNSSTPMPYEDVLRDNGATNEDIEALNENIETQKTLVALLTWGRH